MAARTNGIKIARIFLKEAEKILDIKYAIIFGSYAKGRHQRYSDIDIAIISNDFNGLSTIERLVLLGKIAWRARTTEIEALGFTPQEYNSVTKYDLLYEIKRSGKVIFAG